MVKRSTWIWLVLFLVVVGSFLYLKYRPIKEEAQVTSTPVVSEYLLDETEGELVGIRIYNREYDIVMLERTTGGLWSVTLPAPAPADQALAEAGATQATALLIVSIVKTTPPLSDMGLDFPSYVIKLSFDSGASHTLEVGDSTPTGSGYYLRLDGGAIYIISQDGVNALLNLLTTPPYLAPTSTPVPTLESELTPAVATSTP
jgi:hypothetical protein